ncbi:Hpt domain-containing protein [Pleionea litopenaei]|uniref:Chemotaxis protein CheA n=1 Tax=Pleionea litopenaei TaxID=3070815 RepID=A0AA51RQW1_9GAMM|nr:Hpt domain-containing protein [Pleionea sp. HL-JVS1]WMS85880.1 Hpt domain-containing protein [Pleionea sp. HL-JVS1]
MADTNEQLALSWVRKEINKSLDQARQGLEAFAENDSDVTQIRFCISCLHQVRGTLQMLEFHGASLFAEEMEHLAEAIAEGKFVARDKALEVLMASMLQLPSYLDRVQEGRRDLPVILLPLLNELRGSRGAKPVSESAIFAPQIAGIEPPSASAGKKQVDAGKFGDLAKKFRTHYQKGLLGVIKGQNIKEGIQRMHKVLEKLEEETSGHPVAHLWWVADGFLFSIIEKGQFKDPTVHALLGRIDRHIKRLADLGADALNDTIPDDLLKNLLYYVAKAESQNEKVLRLKEKFNLASSLLSDSEVEEERRRLQGPDAGAIETVVSAINDDLINVKDTLDLFVRGTNKTPDKIRELIPSLQKITDTLGILGLGIPRDVIKQQITTLSKVADAGENISDAVVMDVAGALLFVEANLANIKSQELGQNEESTPEELAAKQDQAASEAQLDDAKLHLLKASRGNLQKAKEKIVDFIASSFDFSLVADVPVLLTEIQGGLQIVGFNDASDLLNKAHEYVEKRLIHEKHKPEEQVMDALADIITTVEYCLENYGEIGSKAFDSVIGAAQESQQILEADLAKAKPIPQQPKEAPVEPTPQREVQQSVTTETPAPTDAPVKAPVEYSSSQSSAEKAYDESLIDDDVLEIFLEEAEEELASINELFPLLQENHDDEESLTTIRRSFHTLKGSGRLVGASLAGELAWSIENMLNRVMDDSIKLNNDVFAVMRDAIDFMPKLIDAFSKNQIPSETPDQIMARAHAIAKGETYTPPAAAPEQTTVDEAVVDEVTVEEPATIEPELVDEPIVAEDSMALEDTATDDLQIEEESSEEFAVESAEEPSSELPSLSLDDEPSFDSEDEISLELPEEAITLEESVQQDDEDGMELSFDDSLDAADDVETTSGGMTLEDDSSETLEFESEPEAFEFTDSELTLDTGDELESTQAEEPSESDEVELTIDELPESLEPVGVDDVLEISESLDADEEIPTLEMSEDLSVDESADLEEYSIGEATSQSVRSNIDPVLLEIFVNEAEGHLEVIDDCVENWKPEHRDFASDELLRAMHTLKGSAHMAEVTEVADLAAPLESIVKEYKQRNIPLTDQFKSDMALARDYLHKCISALKSNQHYLGDEKTGLAESFEEQRKQLIQLLGETESSNVATVNRDPELLAIFLAEGMDIVSEAQELLTHWQQKGSLEAQHNLQAEMHTLKRGANMAMLDEVEQIASALESYVSKPDQATLDEGFYQLGNRALDCVLELLNTAAVEHQLPDPSDLIAELKQWHQKHATPVITPKAVEAEPEGVSETILPEDVHQAEDEIDDELLEFFLEEADELIEEIEANLESWKSDLGDLLPVNNLQRNLHTFKGSARMAGVMNLGNIAHALEDLYEAIGSAHIDVNPHHIEFSFTVLDYFRNVIEQLREDGQYDYNQDLLDDIKKLVAGEQLDSATESEEISETLETEQDVETEIAPAVEEVAEHVSEPVEAEVQHVELDEDGEEVLEIYLEEAAEILQNMDEALQVWSKEPENKSSIETLQRSLHTLKGGARLSDLTALGDLTHELETFFEKVSAGQIKANDEHIRFVMRGYDVIHHLVDEVGASRMLTTPTAYMTELMQVIKGKPAAPIQVAKPTEAKVDTPKASEAKPASPAKAAEVVPFEKKKAEDKEASVDAGARRSKQQEVVRIAADQLESLVNLSGETSIFRARLEQQISLLRYNLDEMNQALDRLKDQLRNMEIETDAQIEYRREVAGVDYEEFDPLEFDRYTRQQELTRSLGESAADIASLKESLDNLASDSETLLLQQGRVNTEMSERLMRTRMVPFDSLVPRLRRIVRQIGNELGKAVDLSIAAEGEMDRTVLERMIAPIEHMLRNAMDHGIESTEERQQAGKSETGKVRIRLYREGSEIYIEIQDDGRGLNIDAIRNKALERGLITQNSELSDHELQQMIFEAGFSTAQKVTQISGRGVGMDVVSSEIKQMGGVVEINSERGKGATFTVKLPFTVSVNQALMISVGDDVFAVPLTNIEGIVRVSPYEIQEYYDNPDARFEYAGMSYHMRYMGNLLDHNVKADLEGVSKPLPVLLLHGAEHPTAVQVDELMGSREIVVKSVGQQLSLLSGLSGATILGDGRVVLILDVPALTRRADATITADMESDDTSYEDRVPTVMVVDDSITVRKVTQRLLQRHDYEVVLAKDGVDALNVLSDTKPDVMLLDIEMPRMDGFELATIIRHDDKLKELPIIMITSRTGEKHRERAESIGVNRYMGKPYNEVDLLQTIESLLPGKQ